MQPHLSNEMRYFFFGILSVCMVACQNDPCADDLVVNSLEGDLKVAGDVIFDIRAEACPESIDSNTAEGFWTQAYFRPMANEAGLTVEEAFELGQEQIAPIEIVANDQHFDGSFIEVRNLETLASNIDRKNFDFSYEKVNGSLQIQANTELSAHPLLLYLSLAGPRDRGGAKNWKVDRITKDEAGVNSVDSISKWDCAIDNEYAFQKGNRVRYDANGPEDDGSLCQQELDYLDGQEAPEYIYGNYEVSLSENDGVSLDIFVNDPNNAGQTLLKLHFPVVSYDWFSMTLQVENDEGEIAYAQLISTGTFSEI